MERVIIKYKSGVKMNQQEIFSLPLNKDILIGRDPSAEVIFDAQKEDMVSRQHARISQEPDQPATFSLTDLHSRNGTFVNRNRITGDVKLKPGDIVQFGPAGPEIEFDLDPRPATQPPVTRLMDAVDQKSVGLTREMPVQSQIKPSKTTDGSGPGNVGRLTVERMIVQSKKENKKLVVNVAAGLAALVVIAACLLIYFNKSHKVAPVQLPPAPPVQKNQALTAADITKQYLESTVFIETSWVLIHVGTGRQLFHQFYPQCSKNGKNCEFLPVYIRIGNYIEPLLDTEAKSKPTAKGDVVDNQPIGGQLTGTGFVVSSDGFIMTNKHVAATWECQSYHWPYNPFPGLVITCNETGCSEDIEKIEANSPSAGQAMAALAKWVPSNTKTLGGKPYKGKKTEGRNDFLTVTFPRQTDPIRASITNISDSADATMIKISVPYSLKPVKISDKDVVQGEPAIVIGYPSVSPDVIAVTKSYEPGRSERSARIIPEPSTSNGIIQRLIRGNVDTNKESEVEYYSTFGDVYQLAINTTGSGNSGGPVFNDKGEVIGIFTYGWSSGGAAVSGAVPIKYAASLMGIQRVIK